MIAPPPIVEQVVALPEPGTPNSRATRRMLRDRLFEQQGGICAYCDEPMRQNSGYNTGGPHIASLDHVIPISRGGTDTEDNIVLACWQCNRLKGNVTVVGLRRLADRIEAYDRKRELCR